MGRAPCCDKTKVKRGPWSPEEDTILKNFLAKHGTAGNWITLPNKAGLRRCGKSCRLRWLNYLRPDIKHGGFTEEEDNIICSLYSNIGSRWSIIASQLPGRTDNDVKNYWNTKLKKKLLAGKVSLNSNINNKDITTNNISHLIGSTPASASNILKVENCNDYGNSSTDFNANPKSERDMFYHQNLDPEGIILDPISFQVPFPRLMEVSDHSTSAHKIIDYSKSSSQEASSLSISSSSPLTLESNYVSWSANNGNAEEEASLLDFMSFESPYGFLQGFDQFPENKQ